MSIIKSSQLSIQEINFSKPYPYTNGSGCAVYMKSNNKSLFVQTPRMLCLYGLNAWKDEKTDKITSITITLQFNSSADKPNRVDNFLKRMSRLDNLVMTTAKNNSKTWLKYHRTIPNTAIKALYKKSFYYKQLAEGGIDHSVPPTFKVKIPYYNGKMDFTLLDENNEPMEFDLEYLQKKIVDKCYIKCIFNPVIWIRNDKNFGVTYNVKALQIIENPDKEMYNTKKTNKKTKEDNLDNPNKIENYFGNSKNDDSDDDDSDEETF